MAEKKGSKAPAWHEKVPQYVDLSDGEPHAIQFVDEGTEAKIPGSKSDLNISFLVKEWSPEKRAWEPNNMTIGAKRALRAIVKLQEDTGALKDRYFQITRTGESYDTKYEIAELGPDEVSEMEAQE